VRFLTAWLPVIVLQLTIFWMSSRTLSGPSLPFPHLDKLAHIVEYAALGGLLYRAFRLSGGHRRESALFTLGLIAGLGFADEKLQSRVPGRDSSGLDWIADMVGGAAGIALGSFAEGRGVGRWARSSAKVSNSRK